MEFRHVESFVVTFARWCHRRGFTICRSDFRKTSSNYVLELRAIFQQHYIGTLAIIFDPRTGMPDEVLTFVNVRNDEYRQVPRAMECIFGKPWKNCFSKEYNYISER